MIDRQDAYTLHRYFIWSNRMHLLAARLQMPNEEFLDRVALLQFSTYFGYWLGALYVVVEGWRELGLSDNAVDDLLADAEQVERLKRFRNGMFHFQRNYHDPRFLDLLSQPKVILPWARKLHQAFSSWFIRELIDPTENVTRSDSSFEFEDPESGRLYRVEFNDDLADSRFKRVLMRIRRWLAG